MSAITGTPNILAFSISRYRFGFFLPEVAQLCVETTISAVPFSHLSMAGLLCHEDLPPIPIFDIQCILEGGPARPSVPGAQIILADSSGGNVGLRMNRLLGTFALPENTRIEPLQPSERADLPPLLRSVCQSKTQLEAIGTVFFFSPAVFLQQIDQQLAEKQAKNLYLPEK